MLPPFTPREVSNRLQATKNTAPGFNGITYGTWKKVDPGSRILAELFSLLLRFGWTPEEWKKSRTVLVELAPLGSTLGKLFSALLADRIYAWARSSSQLSFPTQKGFLPGCGGTDCRKRKQEAAIAWLGLEDAFGSIPHSHIFRVLREMGLPSQMLRIVSQLYTGNTTVIRAGDGYTEPITVLRGVRQGCPLSPFLFNMALEPLLQSVLVKKVVAGYRLGPSNICVLAYADDLVLVARDAGMLRSLLWVTGKAAEWSGLHFKPGKCATMHLDWRQMPGKLLTKMEQGRAYGATTLNSVSNHFMRTGRYLRFCDWRFIHRARLHTLPLKSASWRKNRLDTHCRLCGAEKENLSHVLNNCLLHAKMRTELHDKIISLVADILPREWTIRLNRTISGTGSCLRPDIYLEDGNETVIVDVTVPFENGPEALGRAREGKTVKYNELAEMVRIMGRYQNPVHLGAIVVGALGAWDEQNS
ncbi:hypothetical protein J437_LFUL018723 [Ladona fulva]|uniref:Reverse transcriptase domain-containing protein n=1 Tax=Ladona fulva TaxID=123851 RepID=A0A8K0KTZ3_LADFU|nr:hypothetical protein J437_LFUL018723 [Ladona fulva]